MFENTKTSSGGSKTLIRRLRPPFSARSVPDFERDFGSLEEEITANQRAVLSAMCTAMPRKTHPCDTWRMTSKISTVGEPSFQQSQARKYGAPISVVVPESVTLYTGISIGMSRHCLLSSLL